MVFGGFVWFAPNLILINMNDKGIFYDTEYTYEDLNKWRDVLEKEVRIL